MRLQSSAKMESYDVDMEFQKLNLEYEVQARFVIEYGKFHADDAESAEIINHRYLGAF